MFNIIPPTHDSRYHVMMAILKVVRSSGNFDAIKGQLNNLEQWLEQWEMDDEDQRELYLAVAEVAQETGEPDEAYQYLVKALRTFASEDVSSEKARVLSLRALRDALVHPTHFDFQDLTSLDAIQALRKSDPIYSDLLELFTSEVLEDLNDFKDEHEGWIEAQSLDAAALNRKMRLLTLASIAASTGQSRSLQYSHIAKALQIPEDEVEMWVIDVIRAGLVEGKLSQLNKTFLIHRSTYRVFGENQWREVAARLGMWKSSLTGVLKIVRAEKESFAAQKEQERKDAEAKLNGAAGGTSGGFRNRQPPRAVEPKAVEVDAD
jgi:translation initiation factor 3 subunit M